MQTILFSICIFSFFFPTIYSNKI